MTSPDPTWADLDIISLILAVISLFSTLLLLPLLWLRHDRVARYGSVELLQLLASTQIPAAIVAFIGPRGPIAGDAASLCQAQAALRIFSELLVAFTVFCCAVDHLLLIAWGGSVSLTRILQLRQRVYAPIILVLSLLTALLPLIANIYPVVVPASLLADSPDSVYGIEPSQWCGITDAYPLVRLDVYCIPYIMVASISLVTLLLSVLQRQRSSILAYAGDASHSVSGSHSVLSECRKQKCQQAAPIYICIYLLTRLPSVWYYFQLSVAAAVTEEVDAQRPSDLLAAITLLTPWISGLLYTATGIALYRAANQQSPLRTPVSSSVTYDATSRQSGRWLLATTSSGGAGDVAADRTRRTSTRSCTVITGDIATTTFASLEPSTGQRAFAHLKRSPSDSSVVGARRSPRFSTSSFASPLPTSLAPWRNRTHVDALIPLDQLAARCISQLSLEAGIQKAPSQSSSANSVDNE